MSIVMSEEKIRKQTLKTNFENKLRKQTSKTNFENKLRKQTLKTKKITCEDSSAMRLAYATETFLSFSSSTIEKANFTAFFTTAVINITF